MGEITIEQFHAVDMRVGRVVRAEVFPEARKPAYKLWVDFGELGVRQSSAQITRRYLPETLAGRMVVAVVNLPVRVVAGFRSEVLVLGAVGEDGDVILLQAEGQARVGDRVA